MSTVAIIQARMGSTRLPGKVLEQLQGEPVLARVVQRARRARRVDSVIVATTTSVPDQAIVAECARLAVPCYRGSEEDVLDRYLQAARGHNAQHVVRITADCPLIDPELMDQVVAAFFDAAADYASLDIESSYPRGLDVEVVSAAALEVAGREARLPYERVHVMPFFYHHPERFRLVNVKAADDLSHYRWTLDTKEDLEFLRAVCARLPDVNTAGWRDVLAVLEREPALAAINAGVRQKTLQEG